MTTLYEEKKGKETERVEQILRFNMKMTVRHPEHDFLVLLPFAS